MWDATLRQQLPDDATVEKIAYVIRTREVAAGCHRITTINCKLGAGDPD